MHEPLNIDLTFRDKLLMLEVIIDAGKQCNEGQHVQEMGRKSKSIFC